MTREGSLVVARFFDGRLVKGRTTDFHPEDTIEIHAEGASRPTLVRVDSLKALFFIKSLAGDPAHQDRKDYREPGIGHRIWIEFLDGEELAGWSMTFSPDQESLRIFPADPESNIEMVYVLRSSLRRVLKDQDAEIAAREYGVRRRRDEPVVQHAVSADDWERFLTG